MRKQIYLGLASKTIDLYKITDYQSSIRKLYFPDLWFSIFLGYDQKKGYKSDRIAESRERAMLIKMLIKHY